MTSVELIKNNAINRLRLIVAKNVKEIFVVGAFTYLSPNRLRLQEILSGWLI